MILCLEREEEKINEVRRKEGEKGKYKENKRPKI
jgi:hypothetical protein